VIVRRLLPLAAAALLAAGCVSASPATKPVEQVGRSRSLSRGQEGAIRDKIRQCWNVDLKETAERPVQIRIQRMNPDGTIPPAAVSILDDGGNPIVAQHAARAVLNPACQPWPMPAGGWPDDSFILVFDSKDL
jgi:protein-disulfide isomerase